MRAAATLIAKVGWGIGRALARELVGVLDNHGYGVIPMARDCETLEAPAPGCNAVTPGSPMGATPVNAPSLPTNQRAVISAS